LVSRAHSANQLESKLAATPELWDVEVCELAASLRVPPDDYWRERSRRPWA
jgi:hypothetical protein